MLDEAVKAWTDLTLAEKGWYAGQLVGAMAAEVAASVAISAASAGAGAGAAAKAVNLPRKLEKLAETNHFFKFLATPRVMNKLKAANARLAHLLGTALCFAAGTPVHTADGLRPIESIRPGDLVWTRRDDGPADAPLVLRAVEAALVTDSSALLHLTVRTCDSFLLPTAPPWFRKPKEPKRWSRQWNNDFGGETDGVAGGGGSFGFLGSPKSGAIDRARK
ncbi:MAG: Hint domain-containing protein [Planctomycetia bacterium]